MRLAILNDPAAPSSLTVLTSNATLFGDLYLAALTDAGVLRAEDEPPEIRERPEFISALATINTGLLNGVAGRNVIANPPPFPDPDGDGNHDDDLTGTVAFFERVKRWLGHTPNAYGGFGLAGIPDASSFDLQLKNPTHFETFIIQAGEPEEVIAAPVEGLDFSGLFGASGGTSDLVSIVGPSGFGNQNMAPANVPLPYSLTVEQPASASSAVRELRIVSQLDSDLNPRSFALSDIRLGTLEFAIPDGRAAHTAEYDFVDERGFVLQVTAGYETSTGTVTWLFRAIDPFTGRLVEDVDLGFLLPGEKAELGYSIRPELNATTGVQIDASARVFVGATSTPLDTNVVRNILDAAAPVTTLDVVSLGDGDYRLQWQGTDDPFGSGVAQYSVYVQRNEGSFSTLAHRTTELEWLYDGVPGETVRFVVRAQDAAGNIEAAPTGLLLPPLIPAVNLGSFPTVINPTPESPPPTDFIPASTPANALFVQAQLGVPSLPSVVRPASFTVTLEPFVMESFVSSIPGSGAGIGPLGIAFAPDGEAIYISGGAGRNELYRFTLAGGAAGAPLARLDTPIYDMAFDAVGQLWATSGGEELLLLDPETGLILERFAAGVTLGMAADPTAPQLYVATASGVGTFDTLTHTLRPFSSTRVDGLALAPDGSLWGARWPAGGEVIRFDSRGQATTMLTLDHPAEALAFGQPGTPLEGLLFVSHDRGGELVMVDLASLQTLAVARGGTRGDFLHVGPDGRLFVTQSNQVDVLSPIVVPRVLGITPNDGSSLAPLLNTATVLFSTDMLTGSAAGSVTSAANYRLLDVTTGEAIDIDTLIYLPVQRLAIFQFEPLLAGTYQLEVLDTVRSNFGAQLDAGTASQFQVLENVTSNVSADYLRTRYNRAANKLSFDTRITNTSPVDLDAPIQLIFDGLRSGDQRQDASFVDPSDRAVYNIQTSGMLPSSETTSLVTLSFGSPTSRMFTPAPIIAALPSTNLRPQFSTTPGVNATSQTPYVYDADAVDPDGPAVQYVLIRAPRGATVDNGAGEVSWTPTYADAQGLFELRAYDLRGGYSRQTWTVNVTNSNAPPVVLPITNRTIAEGERIEIPFGAFDAEGDPLVYWMNKLPAGSSFDAATRTFRWTPGPTAAGRYSDLELHVSDGSSTVVRKFEILVTNANQPPVLAPIADRTTQEGGTLAFQLAATDPDHDKLTFTASSLPPGALLNPNTGELAWTPTYSQHGAHVVTFGVTDGHQTVTQAVTLTVLNVNGPVKFERLGDFRYIEGQSISLRIAANDPDHRYAPANYLPDGSSESTGLFAPTLVWQHTALPAGASFDPDSQLLTWTPTYQQAGEYSISFTVMDDGDGTGTTTSDTTVLNLEVVNDNGEPVVTSVATQSVRAGESLTFNIEATDPDGEMLDIAITGLPSYATVTNLGGGRRHIQVQPTLFDRGNFLITVSATDQGDGVASAKLTGTQQFILNVVADNIAPRLETIGNPIAVVGEELVLLLKARDPDQDPLTFYGSQLPAEAIVLPGNIYGQAELRWTPQLSDLGTHPVTVNVIDSGNGDLLESGSDSQSFAIVVREFNTAPVLAPIGNRTVTEGEELVVNLAATDADGDPLRYNAAGVPAGATFDPVTGEFRWTPSFVAADIGPRTVIFGVSDGNRSSQESVRISIVNSNQPPIIVRVPNLLAQEGAPLQFTVAASDPDADPVTLYVESGMPTGATFDPQTALFSWTPDSDQQGNYTVRFAASDPGGLITTRDVNIEVRNVNRPPVLTDMQGRVALIGQPFTLAIEAEDADGDALTYTATGLPALATLDPHTGVIQWTPAAFEAGAYDVRISATDGAARRVNSLHLVASQTPVPPHVVIQQTPSFVGIPGQKVTLEVLAAGIAPVTQLSISVAGQNLPLDNLRRAVFLPPAPGIYDVVATATDIQGTIGTTHSQLLVRDPADRFAPVVTLALDGATNILNTNTDVRVSVFDTNLASYALTLRPLSSAATMELARGTTNFADAVLTTLRPGELANGIYELVLTARDISGRQSVARQNIEINSTNKSGAFEERVTDATFTLGGVQIPITRVYRSTDRDLPSKIGYGWRLAALEPRLEFSVPVHAGELVPPLRAGTRVYIDLPDGSRGGFTFTPQPHPTLGNTFVTPQWTADAGVDFSFSTPALVLQAQEGAFFAVGGRPYHPLAGGWQGPDYTVTTAAGVCYEYEANEGLTAIVGSAGERIVVSDSGLIAADGSRLRFESSITGQLSLIDSADGTQVGYQYDAAGQLTSVIVNGQRSQFGYDDQHLLITIVAGANSREIRYDSAGHLDGIYAITQIAGSTQQFLGATFAGSIAPAGAQRASFTIGPRELAATQSGTVIVGVEVVGVGADPLEPAVPRINGLTLQTGALEPNRAVGLASVNSAGIRTIEVLGQTAASAGSYELSIYIAGDVNLDGRVDGVDEGLLIPLLGLSAEDSGYVRSADANRDGVIDAIDRELLTRSFGFIVNQSPTASDGDFDTIAGIPLDIDLSQLAADLDRDPLTFAIMGASHGTVALVGDGHTVRFTPAVGFSGEASFQFSAADDTSSSPAATVRIAVSAATLTKLEIAERDPSLPLGESLQLHVIGTFADGTKLPLPLSYATYQSSDPTRLVVTDLGTIYGQVDGFATIIVSAGGLTAATPVAVGTTPAPTSLEFFPLSYVLATSGDTRQYIVRELQADGAVLDVSSAASGTSYYVADPSIATISADGLLTTQSAPAGSVTYVTMIHNGQSAVAELRLVSPSVGATIVSAEGAIVTNTDGYGVGIPPGTFEQLTTVQVTTLSAAEVTAPLPGDLVFAGAFQLDLGGVKPDGGLAAIVPAPAGSQIGDTFALFRLSKFLVEPGVFEDRWQLVDTMKVQPGGVARSTSPPNPEIAAEGMFLMASAFSGSLAFTALSLGVVGTVQLSQARLARVEIEPESGQPFFAMPGLFFNFFVPILNQKVGGRGKLFNGAGEFTETLFDVEVGPGEQPNIKVNINAPPPDDRGITLLGASVAIESAGEALASVLTLTGNGFDTENIANNVVLLFAPSDGVPGFDTTIAKARARSETLQYVSVSATELKVVVPKAFELAGGSVRVDKIVPSLDFEPGGDNVDDATTIAEGRIAELEFGIPYYVLAANEASNNVTVINPIALRGIDPIQIQPNTINEEGVSLTTNVYTASSGDAGVVARIPVGLNPTDVVVTPDGMRALVTNMAEGTISIIDLIALQEIDIKPETPEIDRITFAGSHPYRIVLNPNEHLTMAAVIDRDDDKVYFFNYDDLTYLNDFTFDVDPYDSLHLTGLTGIEFSADGNRFFVTTPGEQSFAGQDLPIQGYVIPVRTNTYYDWFNSKFWEIDGAISIGSKPFGITRSPNPKDPTIAVAVRGSEAAGVKYFNSETGAITERIPTNLRGYEPTLPEYVLVQTRKTDCPPGKVPAGQRADGTSFCFVTFSDSIQRNFFDINSAEQIVFPRTETPKNAFVLFNNTFKEKDLSRDAHNGMGGNVGILRDPLTNPHFIGATLQAPFSFPDEMTIDPYNQFLMVAYKGLNQIWVYDLNILEEGIELLSEINPAALENPYRSLDELIFDLVQSGSLERYLEQHGPVGGNGEPSPDNPNTMTEDEFTERVTTMRRLGGSILVAKIESGRLPSGIASSPEAPPNIIALKATLKPQVTEGAGRELAFDYIVTGKLTDSFVAGVYASDDEFVDLPNSGGAPLQGAAARTGNIDIQLQEFAVAVDVKRRNGVQTASTNLKQPRADLGKFLGVFADPYNQLNELVRDDNPVTTEVSQLSLKARYYDEKLEGKIIGTFLEDVPVQNKLTITIDENVDQVKSLWGKWEATNCTAQGTGTACDVRFVQDQEDPRKWSAEINMMDVPPTSDGLNDLTITAYATTQPSLDEDDILRDDVYSFRILALPDWVKTAGAGPDDKKLVQDRVNSTYLIGSSFPVIDDQVEVKIEFDGSAAPNGVYHVTRDHILAKVGFSIYSGLPALTFDMGTRMSFAYDVAQRLTEEKLTFLSGLSFGRIKLTRNEVPVFGELAQTGLLQTFSNDSSISSSRKRQREFNPSQLLTSSSGVLLAKTLGVEAKDPKYSQAEFDLLKQQASGSESYLDFLTGKEKVTEEQLAELGLDSKSRQQLQQQFASDKSKAQTRLSELHVVSQAQQAQLTKIANERASIEQEHIAIVDRYIAEDDAISASLNEERQFLNGQFAAGNITQAKLNEELAKVDAYAERQYELNGRNLAVEETTIDARLGDVEKRRVAAQQELDRTLTKSQSLQKALDAGSTLALDAKKVQAESKSLAESEVALQKLVRELEAKSLKLTNETYVERLRIGEIDSDVSKVNADFNQREQDIIAQSEAKRQFWAEKADAATTQADADYANSVLSEIDAAKSQKLAQNSELRAETLQSYDRRKQQSLEIINKNTEIYADSEEKVKAARQQIEEARTKRTKEHKEKTLAELRKEIEDSRDVKPRSLKESIDAKRKRLNDHFGNGKKDDFFTSLSKTSVLLTASKLKLDPATLDIINADIQASIEIPGITWQAGGTLAAFPIPAPPIAGGVNVGVEATLSAKVAAKFTFQYGDCNFGDNKCFAEAKGSGSGRTLDGYATAALEGSVQFELAAFIRALANILEAKASFTTAASLSLQLATIPEETRVRATLSSFFQVSALINTPLGGGITLGQTPPFTLPEFELNLYGPDANKQDWFRIPPNDKIRENFYKWIDNKVAYAKSLLHGGSPLLAGGDGYGPDYATAGLSGEFQNGAALGVGNALGLGAALLADDRESALGLGVVDQLVTTSQVANSLDTDYIKFRLNDFGAAGDELRIDFAPNEYFELALVGPADQVLLVGEPTITGLAIDLEDLPPGLYYALVLRGPADAPAPYTLSVSGPQVDKPNLVADLSVPPSAITLGDLLPLTVTIANTGTQIAPASQARLLFSRDAELDAGDASLIPANELQIPSLAPGESFTKTFIVKIPEQATGFHVLGLYADWGDKVTNESAEFDNQILFPIEVVLPLDKFESNDTISDATWLGSLNGDTIALPLLNFDSSVDEDNFVFRMLTTGTADDRITLTALDGSVQYAVQIYDSNGNIVAEITPDALGGNSFVSIDLAGLQPGSYLLRTFTIGNPEFYQLEITSAPRYDTDAIMLTSNAPATLSPGVQSYVNATFVHYSGLPTYDATAYVELETADGRVYVGDKFYFDSLEFDERVTVALDVMPPADFAGENVTMRIIVDVGAGDLNPADNVLTRTIQVTPLVDDAELAEQETGSYEMGVLDGPTPAIAAVLANGQDQDRYHFHAATPPVAGNQVQITLDAIDLPVSAFLVAPDGQLLTATLVGNTLSIDLAGLPAGDFDLFIYRDDAEPASVSYTLAITAPAAVSGSDLVPTKLLLDLFFVEPGKPLVVTGTIKNQGNVDATDVSVQYVLSTDENLSLADDIPLGAPQVFDLAAGMSITSDVELQIPAGLAMGSMYLGIVVDGPNAVVERIETNNTIAETLVILPVADLLEPNDSIDVAAPIELVNGQYTASGLTIGFNDEDNFVFALTQAASSGSRVVLTFDASDAKYIAAILSTQGQVIRLAESANDSLTLDLAGLPAGNYVLAIAGATELDFSPGYGIQMVVTNANGAGVVLPPLAPRSPAPSSPPSTPSAPPPTGSSNPAPSGTVNVNAPLSQVVVSYTALALEHWRQVTGRNLQIQIDLRTEDLPAGYLGFAELTTYAANGLPAAGILRIDTDASGRGWFLDTTPNEASEFITTEDAYAFANGPAGFDLYTVILHEVGHLLGLTDQFSGFNSQLNTSPDGQVWFAAEGQRIPVTDDGHHLDPEFYPLDLLSPVLYASTRKYPSVIDAMLLRAARDNAAPSEGSGGGAGVSADVEPLLADDMLLASRAFVPSFTSASSASTEPTNIASASITLLPPWLSSVAPLAKREEILVTAQVAVSANTLPVRAPDVMEFTPQVFESSAMMATPVTANRLATSSLDADSVASLTASRVSLSTTVVGEVHQLHVWQTTPLTSEWATDDTSSAISAISTSLADSMTELVTETVADTGIATARLEENPWLAFAAAVLGIATLQALRSLSPRREERDLTPLFAEDEDWLLAKDGLALPSDASAKELFASDDLIEEWLEEVSEICATTRRNQAFKL
jgi:YD repeat-containing protein